MTELESERISIGPSSELSEATLVETAYAFEYNQPPAEGKPRHAEVQPSIKIFYDEDANDPGKSLLQSKRQDQVHVWALNQRGTPLSSDDASGDVFSLIVAGYQGEPFHCITADDTRAELRAVEPHVVLVE